jgi:type II secretory pathway pseudopilin PulG
MKDEERGFTIIETIVCAGLLATLAAGGAHLVTRAVADADAVRTRTVAAVAAFQKMEQLRSLAWGIHADGQTDLTLEDPAPGGTGLLESPPGTLDADVAGHVDYLSADGIWLSAVPIGAAVYARRWSIDAHVTDPHTLVLRVVVTRARGPMRRSAAGRGPRDVEQVTLRTRFQP